MICCSRRRLLLPLFSLCSLFVFLFCFCSNDVSAVSDISYNLSTSSTVPFYICNDSNVAVPHCADYNYLIIEADNTFNGNAYDTLISGVGSFRVPVFGYSIIQIKSSFSSYGLWFNSINHSFKITLTESLDSSAPSGSLSITQNGTYDVSSYAEAVVDVPPEVVQGDYHDDLVSIRNAVFVCASVCLLIYFFFVIFRLFSRTMGGL